MDIRAPGGRGAREIVVETKRGDEEEEDKGGEWGLGSGLEEELGCVRDAGVT
jgi:hypothetical protein